jgi:hypothetical protein
METGKVLVEIFYVEVLLIQVFRNSAPEILYFKKYKMINIIQPTNK